MKKCPNCGQALTGQEKACPNCGFNVEKYRRDYFTEEAVEENVEIREAKREEADRSLEKEPVDKLSRSPTSKSRNGMPLPATQPRKKCSSG
jgi:uncharacterized Zn finger protein (UPF0148 family)